MMLAPEAESLNLKALAIICPVIGFRCSFSKVSNPTQLTAHATQHWVVDGDRPASRDCKGPPKSKHSWFSITFSTKKRIYPHLHEYDGQVIDFNFHKDAFGYKNSTKA